MTTTGTDQRYHFHIFSSSELCTHQTVLNQTVQCTLIGRSLTLTSISSVNTYHIKYVCVYHSVLNSSQVHVRMPVCRTPLRVVRGCVRLCAHTPANLIYSLTIFNRIHLSTVTICSDTISNIFIAITFQ